jgi:hypothetical protein
MLNINSELIANNAKVREMIANAKAIKAYEKQLSSSDYKIIKCYEYSLAGLELPYDINELHIERESIRAEIRKLEYIKE